MDRPTLTQYPDRRARPRRIATTVELPRASRISLQAAPRGDGDATMKMLLAAGAAALLFGAALPAMSPAHGLEQVKRLSSEITSGLRDGSLTKKEGETLRLELIRAEVVENHAAGHGYTEKEDRDLDARYAAVEADIHAMKVNADRVSVRRPVPYHRAAHHRRVVHKAAVHRAPVHKAVIVHKK
jgi:hypothetical protein